MRVAPIVNSIFNSMSYLIGPELAIDVGDYSPLYTCLAMVLLTHCHFDHIYGLNKVIELNPHVRIYTNESGREMLLNARKNLSFYHKSPFEISDPYHIVVVNDGDDVPLDDVLTAKAIFTPGHNPSCITWLIGANLFTGDAYIPGLKTITNLPGGNKKQAEESTKLIKRLAVGRIVYPGHKVDTYPLKL